MALYRKPIICSHCGYQNHFVMNKLSQRQKMERWVGDNGGHYPTKCKDCGRPLIQFKKVDLTEEEKKFLKDFNKLIKKRNECKHEFKYYQDQKICQKCYYTVYGDFRD